MPVFKSHSHLINDLAAELVPVRRLWPPALRAAFWLGMVVALAFGLFLVFDITSMLLRFEHVPEARASLAGSVIALVLGALAVFHLCLPDRSPVWILLPMPGVGLWIAATGMNGLRHLSIPTTHWYSLREAPRSFVEVIVFSIPLTALLIVMLRRAYTLHPVLTSLCGGITVAAASVSLVYMFHPYDEDGTDLLVLLLALGVVGAATHFLSHYFLKR